ncbi:DeoR/GlpR family DNA-binding transcription regulator [Devosia sp. 2618]|uniref:DeoR/GlpR family DNA-binding transcription regulator n=1 Tax=Devosia sp. 2618 TaxID=3156454 RepID=UPI00339458F5
MQRINPQPSNAHSALPSQARQQKILQRVHADGSVSVTQIARELQVSDMTVRRDLIELENDKKLLRVHGGAVLLPEDNEIAVDRNEPVFALRMRKQFDVKQRIAAAAAKLLEDSRTIAIDVGTTTFQMVKHIPDTPGLKVFTNSLRIAAEISTPNREVYIAGGRIRDGELAVGGASAVAQFSKLWFDTAVIGISGLTTTGLYDYSFDDTEMKRIYIERSNYKIALCDSSKFEHMSLVKICNLSGISAIVTDALPPDPLMKALEAADVTVVVA